MVSREHPPDTNRRVSDAVKRAFDVVVAAAMLVVLAPVMGMILVLIHLDSAGPAFYRQSRIGRHGVPFTVIKFRTMYEGTSQALHHQASLDWFEGRPQGRRYKSAADPRVTRVGRVLRRSSMDELPQLWNVLRGEMSLVGPRPLMEYERARFDGADFERESVRPGITGLWQVSGRDRLSAPEMLALDVRYARRRSTRLDLVILLRTVLVVLGDVRGSTGTDVIATRRTQPQVE
jgi:lipopolysaccharide/colanic/teichoic acid biosynthesis glycosyltransferase